LQIELRVHAGLVMRAQLAVGDGEQPAAEAAVAAEARQALDAGQEGPLDQLGAGLADLVDKEAGHRLVVAGEQPLAGRAIAGPPGRQPLVVVVVLPEHARRIIAAS
jgi:hypothetical protein